MYDMKDKYDRYYVLQHALFNEPIDFYGFNLYCPTIKDILKMGERKYTELLSPILSDLSFYVGDDSLNSDDLLEHIFKQRKNNIIGGFNTPILFDFLKESLSYFFKLPCESIDECVGNSIILLSENKSTIIDIKKFKELRDIICEITKTKIYTYLDIKKKESEQKIYSSDPIMNERIKRYENAKKISEKAKEKTENKVVELYNVMSFVCNHKGYEVVKEYNIYQLLNTYEFINADTSFKFNLKIASSGFASENFRLQDIKEVLAK